MSEKASFETAYQHRLQGQAMVKQVASDYQSPEAQVVAQPSAEA